MRVLGDQSVVFWHLEVPSTRLIVWLAFFGSQWVFNKKKVLQAEK
jgi:hypothetical protein